MHIFIISWPGVHPKAHLIANALAAQPRKVSIVFSDEDANVFEGVSCEVISRPNHLFWADKFSACLENLQAERMLVIHADCSCENWIDLLEKAESTMNRIPKIGVWAPLIDNSSFGLQRSFIADIANESLKIVSNTDGIIFALEESIIQRMQQADYSENLYGWGIDSMFSACAYTKNLLAVVDTSIEVKHPVSTGYQQQIAYEQWRQFLKQLTTDEMAIYTMAEGFAHRNDLINRENA